MNILVLLIPVTLCMGVIGLVAFFWSLQHRQYEDLSGDAERILHADDCPIRTQSPPAQSPPAERQTKETAI